MSLTVIVKLHVAVWAEFADNNFNCAALPSIDAVTFPVVASVIKFIAVTSFASILSIAPLTVMVNAFAPPFANIFDKFVDIAADVIILLWASLTPANVTLPAVFPTRVLPCVTVTESDTINVITSVDAVVRLANLAIAELANDAVTTPLVALVTLFKAITLASDDVIGESLTATNAVDAVTFEASVFNAATHSAKVPAILIAFDTVTVPVVSEPIPDKSAAATVLFEVENAASFISIATFVVLAVTVVKSAKSDAPAFKFATESVIFAPYVTVPVVPATILFACASVAVSSIVIVNAHVAAVPVAARSSNSAALPSILASTVPVVPAAIKFTAVTSLAVISSIVPVIVTATASVPPFA